jgi:cytochrome c oxidase subunit I+III
MGSGLQRDHGPLPIGHGLSVPPHTEATGALPWWALVFALVADATLFTSLVFGTLYLWIAAPAWPTSMPAPDGMLAVGAVVALAVAAFAARCSLQALRAEASPQGWMVLAALALIGCIVAVVSLIGALLPRPQEHALGATASVLLGYIAAHAGIGLLFLLSNLLRLRGGWVSIRRCTDLRLTRLWLDYSAVTGAIAIGLVLSLPSLVAMLGARG